MAWPASEKPSRAWIITGPRPSADDSCGAGNSSSYIPVCSGWYCCPGLSAVLSHLPRLLAPSVAHFAVDAIAAYPVVRTSQSRRHIPAWMPVSREHPNSPSVIFCHERRDLLPFGQDRWACASPRPARWSWRWTARRVAVVGPARGAPAGARTAATVAPKTTPTAQPVPPDPRVGCGVPRRRSAAHLHRARCWQSAAGDLILTAAHCLAEGVDATFVAGLEQRRAAPRRRSGTSTPSISTRAGCKTRTRWPTSRSRG